MKLVTEILGGSQAETVKEGQGMTDEIKKELDILFADSEQNKNRATAIIKALEGLTIAEAGSMLNACQIILNQCTFRMD